MNPVESIKTCFRKYIDFSGRASRSEYWWFTLFAVIILAATAGIPLLRVVQLLLLLPLLAVGARRLHDIDQTGWWLLLGLIPFVGGIVLLIMLVQPGTNGPNRYGPAPFRPPGTSGYPPIPGPPYTPPPDAYGAAAPPPYTPSGRRYCPQCGAERTSDDARFCTVCGAAF